jgi:hypothetical protein
MTSEGVAEKLEQSRVEATEKRDHQRAEDIRVVLRRSEGRRLLWRLIDEIAGATSLSFQPGDSHVTAFREGRRDVGLTVMSLAQQVDPANYGLMVAEAFALSAQDKLLMERAAEEAEEAAED